MNTPIVCVVSAYSHVPRFAADIANNNIVPANWWNGLPLLYEAGDSRSRFSTQRPRVRLLCNISVTASGFDQIAGGLNLCSQFLRLDEIPEHQPQERQWAEDPAEKVSPLMGFQREHRRHLIAGYPLCGPPDENPKDDG